MEKDDIEKLTRELQAPLRANEIDFRVQSIVNRPVNGGWSICANMLAYKDARCDMGRLDEVFGIHGWQRLHKEIKGAIFGGVAIRGNPGEWVEKWDVGEPSNVHAIKGEASDAFKRACFNLGIGRELYDYPQILVPLKKGEWKEEPEKSKKYRATYDIDFRSLSWFNQFDGEGKLSYLACKQIVNGKSELRYKWGEFEKPPEPLPTREKK